jgi:enterochelin esterase-like enzyme
VGLTSPALMAVVAVVAAAALAAILWFWPRLAGRGVVPVMARIGALGVLQLSVLGLIFLIVNSSAEFYSSWSDLLGDQSGGGAIVAGQDGHAGTSQNAVSSQALAPLTVLAASAVAVPDRPKEAGGQLQTVRLYGQLSGLSALGYVYLPPGYRPQGGTALPVTVVISGDLNSPSNPYGAGALAGAAASQIAAHRLAPMIIVMLPAELGQHDQGCLNVPGGSQADLFFTQDLPQIVGSAYRAATPAAHRWAAVGDSSGGYCALQLAMTSSGTFALAAVPPGGYTAPPGPAESGGSPQIRAQEDLSWLLEHQPMQPISVLFTGGRTAQPFVTAARPPMHVGQTSLPPGRWQLTRVFDWIGSTRQPPAVRS